MNSKKEIWHLWDGDTSRDMSFIKGVTAVKFKDGSFIVDIDDSSAFREKPLMWFCWQTWGNNNIAAYTFGETRGRCIDCKSSRFKGLVYCGGYFEYRKCETCNGRGWV